jgi:hypothetical protein
VALGQVFPRVLRFSPVNFIPLVLHYLHLHHRVAQEALRLRCVRSVCCGALHHHKKLIFSIFFQQHIPKLSKHFRFQYYTKLCSKSSLLEPLNILFRHYTPTDKNTSQVYIS